MSSPFLSKSVVVLLPSLKIHPKIAGEWTANRFCVMLSDVNLAEFQ